jgi:hypothetical protein
MSPRIAMKLVAAVVLLVGMQSWLPRRLSLVDCCDFAQCLEYCNNPDTCMTGVCYYTGGVPPTCLCAEQ